MKNKISLAAQFNWKILLIRLTVNSIALILTAGLMPLIYFPDRKLWHVLAVAAVLGVLNAFLKPLLQFLTAQIFFATFGLLVILINTALLYVLDWIFPAWFQVDSFLWAVLGGLVLGLSTNALENLLGLTPPIVPDEETEIKLRIQKQSTSTLQNLAGMPQAMMTQGVETQSIEEVQAARAALELLEQQPAPEAVLTIPLEPAASPGETIAGDEAASQGGDA